MSRPPVDASKGQPPGGKPPGGRPRGPNLFGLLKPYRKLVLILVVMTILGNSLNLLVPRIISRAKTEVNSPSCARYPNEIARESPSRTQPR